MGLETGCEDTLALNFGLGEVGVLIEEWGEEPRLINAGLVNESCSRTGLVQGSGGVWEPGRSCGTLASDANWRMASPGSGNGDMGVEVCKGPGLRWAGWFISLPTA